MNTSTRTQFLRTFNLFINKPLSNQEETAKFGRVLEYKEAIELLAKRKVPQAVIKEASDAVEIRIEETTWKPQPRISIFIKQ